jgi:hypothetical protein
VSIQSGFVVDFQEKMVTVKRETELKAEDGALEEDAE